MAATDVDVFSVSKCYPEFLVFFSSLFSRSSKHCKCSYGHTWLWLVKVCVSCCVCVGMYVAKPPPLLEPGLWAQARWWEWFRWWWLCFSQLGQIKYATVADYFLTSCCVMHFFLFGCVYTRGRVAEYMGVAYGIIKLFTVEIIRKLRKQTLQPPCSITVRHVHWLASG